MNTLLQKNSSDQLKYYKQNKSFAFIKNCGEWLLQELEEPDVVLPGLLDRGDKLLIVGKSKTRKSFHALQLALSIAAGRSFLGMQPEEPRRVLLIQLEIKESHYHRRVVRMAKAMGIQPNELNNYLMICNGRGLGFKLEDVRKLVKDISPKVLVLDPLYKLIDGDENESSVLKKILETFDQMAERTKTAIIYVHHDKKGQAGDQDISDRGSGSGVLGRDFDASIVLTAHKEKEDATVVEFITRNYAPLPAQTVEWVDFKFVQSDALPVKRTSRTVLKGNKIATSEWVKRGQEILSNDGSLGISIFKMKLKDLGASRSEQELTVHELLASGIALTENRKAIKGLGSKVIRLVESRDRQKELALTAFAGSEVQEL